MPTKLRAVPLGRLQELLNQGWTFRRQRSHGKSYLQATIDGGRSWVGLGRFQVDHQKFIKGVGGGGSPPSHRVPSSRAAEATIDKFVSSKLSQEAVKVATKTYEIGERILNYQTPTSEPEPEPEVVREFRELAEVAELCAKLRRSHNSRDPLEDTFTRLCLARILRR